MIFPEKDAGQFRCCGPEGCGSLPIRITEVTLTTHPHQPPTHEATGAILDPLGVRLCIGAKCAAWTWFETEMTYVHSESGGVVASKPRDNRRGGCGLVTHYNNET